MKRIVNLCFDESIAAVKSFDGDVLVNRGVWNKPVKTSKDSAISAISNSGYGADIYMKDTGEMVVSIPSASDMW